MVLAPYGNAKWVADVSLFLADPDERPNPSPEVVALRFRSRTPPQRRMDKQAVLAAFDLTEEEWADLKRTKGITASAYGKRAGSGQYAEELVAQVMRWHGPLPSEVAWVREMQTRPESLQETQRVYRAKPDEWVYRCYHGAELVYVGVTRTGLDRIREHMATAEWLRHVTCIEIEHFATREESERREAELIARFEPRFNRSSGRVSLLEGDA